MAPNVGLNPTALALFTRDREEDYRWVFEAGPAALLDPLKAIHRDLIADQDAGPAATFAFRDGAEGPGLLVANLKTERHDHTMTHFDDTLLLGFTAGERSLVLRLAAGLLGSGSEEIQRTLLDYAEARYQEKIQAGQTRAEALTLRVEAAAPGTLPPPSPSDRLGSRVALSSNPRNRERVARFLNALARTPQAPHHPLVVITTGFIGRAKLQQHADGCGRFIALTRSSSFPEEGQVSLAPTADDKVPGDQRRFNWIPSIVLVLGLLTALLLGAWLQLGNRTPEPAGGRSPTGESKDLQGSEKR